MAIKTFTTGEVLTASDTNTYLANAGLVYIGTFTNTSTTSLEVTGIGSTYDFYRLVGFFSAGSAAITFQLYDGATARSGSLYYTAGFDIAAITGTLNPKTDNGATSATLFSTAVLPGASFQMDFRYGGSSYYSSWSHFGTSITNGSTEHRSGAYHSAVTADRIRFASSANFSSNVLVYGYRKA